MRQLTKQLLEEYELYLIEEEKSRATIRKYMCDLRSSGILLEKEK